jgi:N-acetylmuramic acid 6-phosphate etherase
MATEDVSARFQDLDAWGDLDILKALYEGQCRGSRPAGG